MSNGPNWQGNVQELKLPKMPKIPTRAIVALGLILLAVVIFFASFYQVGLEEEAVVLRFGKYTGETVKPGPHFKIPLVDSVEIRPVRRQLKQEFGFRTVQAGRRSQYTTEGHADESIMLTGDLNVADVEWIIQYKIQDPYNFLFKVREVEDTLHDLSEAVMREVVGDHSVDEVLTIGRDKVASDAKLHLQQLCDKFETGVKIEQLVLQDVNPPDPVKPSFNEVNQAIQEREQLINEARAQYNKAVPRAKGEAEQMIRRAEGYALERVNNAKGEAARFLSLYEEYRKAPTVTRRRLYLESMGRVLPAMGDKIVVDDNLKGMLPVMNLKGGGTPVVAPQRAGGAK